MSKPANRSAHYQRYYARIKIAAALMPWFLTFHQRAFDTGCKPLEDLVAIATESAIKAADSLLAGLERTKLPEPQGKDQI